MRIFAALLIVLAVILLPVIITLIYTVFYNKHINKGSGKKWLPPFAVGIISFFAVSLLTVVTAFVSFTAYKNSPTREISVDYADNYFKTFTQEEFNGTAYTAFNGRGVSGYRLVNKSSDDFDYQIYTKVSGGPSASSDVVMIIKYTGSDDYKSARAEYKVNDKYGAAANAEYLEKSQVYYVILDDTVVTYKDKNSNTLNIDYDLVYTLGLYKSGADADNEDEEPVAAVSINPYEVS